MDRRNRYSPYSFNGPPSRQPFPGMQSSGASIPHLTSYNANFAARGADGGNAGSFGRGAHAGNGGSGMPMARSRGRGGKGGRGRGGGHHARKPAHDRNFNDVPLSYPSPSYQGFQQQQQQPIMSFQQQHTDGGYMDNGLAHPPGAHVSQPFYAAPGTTLLPPMPPQQQTSYSGKGHWGSERYDDDGDHVGHQIERREALELTCRSLFVRNVKYDVEEITVREIFAQFGEIKTIFNRIAQRGMVFVTFYDIRAAERAKSELQGTCLQGRNIDIHYSLPKEDQQHAECGREDNQGTLLFKLMGTQERIRDDLFRRYVGQFGDMSKCKALKSGNAQGQGFVKTQRLVRYYDSRSCIAAYDACNGQPYGNGIWSVTYLWDHVKKDRNDNFAAKHDHPANNRPETHIPAGRRDGGGYGGGDRKTRRRSDAEDDYRNQRQRVDRQPSRDPRLNDRRDASSTLQSSANGYNEAREQMEKAQAAQELLTKIAQVPTATSPSVIQPPQLIQPPQPAPPTSFPSQPAAPPLQQMYSMPAANPPAAAPAPSVAAQSASAPPDQQAQLKELLDLLVVAQQQMQMQVSQAAAPAAPVVPTPPPAPEPQTLQHVPNPNDTLAQLAQALQQHQQQGTAASQPPIPPYHRQEYYDPSDPRGPGY